MSALAIEVINSNECTRNRRSSIPNEPTRSYRRKGGVELPEKCLDCLGRQLAVGRELRDGGGGPSGGHLGCGIFGRVNVLRGLCGYISPCLVEAGSKELGRARHLGRIEAHHHEHILVHLNSIKGQAIV